MASSSRRWAEPNSNRAVCPSSKPGQPGVAAPGREGFGLLQRFDQVDVVLHRLVPTLALHGGPGVVLGAAHHIGETGALAFHVAFGGLLVERVDLQQGHVVRLLGQVLAVGDGFFEGGFEVGHGVSSPAGTGENPWLTGPMLPSIVPRTFTFEEPPSMSAVA